MARKVTKEEYAHIVRLYEQCGWSVRAIAARYDIPKTTIHRWIKEGVPADALINTDDGV